MNIKYNENFAEGCLYVYVNPGEKMLDFSGKYYLHSLYKNVGAYIREPGLVSDYSSKQTFLFYKDGYWYISNDEENNCFLWGNDGGYFRLLSKG